VMLERVGGMPMEEMKEGMDDQGEGAIALVPSDWIAELDRQVECLRAEFVGQIEQLRQESDAGWFVRRMEGLERENRVLRLERDRAAAAGMDEDEVERLRAENRAIAQELRLVQDKLDAFRQLLDGGEAGAEPIGERGAIVSQTVKAEAKSRGPVKGKAFNRAEAIVRAVKDWNRLYPSESFAISPGLLETVFGIHRRAAKEFFEAYQNELWDYHQEIGVDSPRWHNRGKDTEKLKKFVVGRI
ncbi:MAG: hypothetical protein WCD18_09765, partial [Thermosynechococcaceae cyanobacterium]